MLLVKAIRSYRHREAYQYHPLYKSHQSSYGAIPEDSDADSSNTLVTPQDFTIQRQPWSVYNCSRVVLSAIQLVIIVYMVKNNDGDVDKQVEGSYKDMMNMYYSRIGFWVNKI